LLLRRRSTQEQVDVESIWLRRGGGGGLGNLFLAHLSRANHASNCVTRKFAPPPSVTDSITGVGIRVEVKVSFRRLGLGYYAPALGAHFGIARSVRLSVPWRRCLIYRHAGCLQLSHRRPPEMCGLRNRRSAGNCHRRGHIVSPPPGRYLVRDRITVGVKVNFRRFGLRYYGRRKC